MISRYLHGVYHPEIYHGQESTKQHFEGWYFKIVDTSETICWAVIPGIYKSKDNNEAFIMTLDGRTHKSTYHSFDTKSFVNNNEKAFDISIENNRFSCDSMTLDLPEIKGTIYFDNPIPWPVTWSCPGIMGVFAYFPMECHHGLLSMDHSIRGNLKTPSGPIDFEGGRGYLEKDWGTNFPKTWIWIQANHFKGTPGTSISISIARIPFYGLVFPGFIIGFWYENTLHQFTTYVGAKLREVTVEEKTVTVQVSNRSHRLRVTASRTPTAKLHMPTRESGMVPKVDESVGSVVSLKFYRGDDLIFEGTSQHGGLEVFGDYQMLLC